MLTGFVSVSRCFSIFLTVLWSAVSLQAAGGSQGSLDATPLSQEVSRIFQQASPSLVKIRVASPLGTLTGSGFFYGDGSQVVTSSNMVVVGDGIWVEYGDQKASAKVMGVDRRSCVALLKVDLKGVPLPISTGELPGMGTQLVAAGFPYNLDASPTFGTLLGFESKSPQGKYFCTTHIRSDIRLLPGLVGGPLLDRSGTVVGLVTGSMDNGATTYALPARALGKVVSDLTQHGTVRTGWVGISIEAGSSVGLQEAVAVKSVHEKAPAAQAGIQAGDTIVSIAGYSIRRGEDVVDATFSIPVGGTLDVAVRRGGKLLSYKLPVLERPTDTALPLAGIPTTLQEPAQP